MRESKLKRVLMSIIIPSSAMAARVAVDDIKEHVDEKFAELQESLRISSGKTSQPRDKHGRFAKEVENEEVSEKQPMKVVSPYTDEKGKKWVHVCAGDLDFLLDIQDLTEKEVNWGEANKLAADAGMRLNPKREFQLIGAFKDEIDKCCKELGGKPLEGWYCTGDEYSGSGAWVYGATTGVLSINYKMDSYGVRGSLAFKKS